MRIAIIINLATIFLSLGCKPTNPSTTKFDPIRAYNDVLFQTSLGPRTIGSEAHKATVDYIYGELSAYGWRTEIQKGEVSPQIIIQNVIGKRGEGQPWIILGAHFDSRFHADKDPDPQRRKEPVPGANDGASGVGVLLELARSLPKDLDKQIWLCFFDAEDNGGIEGYEWILGSRFFVANLSEYPDSAVIVDMVGDKDLTIYLERNSDPDLATEIWDIALTLGKEQFIKEYEYTIIDDHIPFVEVGIPAVDIIDFFYPYHHTTSDTIDKVSSESLAVVGETLYAWLTR